MTNECPTCTRPTDAFLCSHCVDETARALGDVPWLVEELEITATRAKGVDYRRAGGGSGAQKPTDRPAPVQWGAAEARRDLTSTLAEWVKFCRDEQVRSTDTRGDVPGPDPLAMSRYLLWRVDGLALHDIAPSAHEEITQAVARGKRVIDTPADKWYAGPCNAEIEGIECGADLYAGTATGNVTCRDCKHIHDVAARRTWLLNSAEDRLADAATLARSVSWLGTKPLNAARVRKWAERGRITAKAHEGTKPLYRIGDAIDLLSQEAS